MSGISIEKIRQKDIRRSSKDRQDIDTSSTQTCEGPKEAVDNFTYVINLLDLVLKVVIFNR